MERKRIYLSSPTMHGEEQAFVQSAFDTNWVAPLGPNVDAFEKEMADYIGGGCAAALSAGTAAIHLAVILAGVKEGDVVFAQSLTFAASVNPACYEKAKPVFIDSEPDTWNMDPVALEKAFEKYPHPAAVIAVHLYGTPSKIKRARFLATQARDPARYYQHSTIGYNYRMSNVVAGIGRGQLLHLEEHKARKNEIYRQYKEAFADIEAITMNPMNPDGDANNWLSCMTIAPDCSVTPDQVMDVLAEYNIETRPIWKPMHLQPVFADCDFIQVKEGRSVSEDIFNRGVCLPSDIKNTPEDMELIIALIRKVFEK